MAKFFLLLVLTFNVSVFQGGLAVLTQTAENGLTPLDFSEETLQKYIEDPDFDYSEAAAEDNWWTKFKRYLALQWQRFLDWLFGEYEAPLLLAIFLDALPYLLLGLLLTFVLYLFSKINPGIYFFGSPSQEEIKFEEEEKIIRTKDIARLIEKAVSRKEYRLAVRYHFLYLLQQMSRLDVIVYDSSKTDEDYLEEIKDPALKSRFKRVNRIYDFVWYGNFETTDEDYLKIKEEFEKTEDLIQSRHEQSV